MITTNRENINSALADWRDMKIAQADSESTQHLEEKVLVRMAADGGLQEASESELEHLDSCPQCLGNWSAWRRAYSVISVDLNDEKNEKDQFNGDAYGFLEAAASLTSTASSRVLESSCGSYRLEILPDREDPEKAMIVFSRRTQNGDDRVTVRDKNGLAIISGNLENGRLARLCSNLKELDLTIWTVMISPNYSPENI